MIFCGIDIGSTNTKAILIDADGGLIDRISIAVDPARDDIEMVGWYEHFCDIFDYFDSKGYLAESKVICSITAMAGSFVLLNENFKPVSRVYNWTENSSEDTVANMINSIGTEAYYHLTGWEPNSWLMACKLKDLVSKNQLPENTRYIATVPDFILSQLTGEFVTDISTAQITGLCNFQKTVWDEKILDWIGIENSFLPKIVDNLSIIFDDVKTRWGKISFATSSHDQYAAIQAAGLAKDKEVMLGTGTAWVINSRTSKPLFNDRNFIIHPGRDIFKESFGNITGIAIGSMPTIGRGLDELLSKFNLTTKQLADMEKKFNRKDFPKGPIALNSTEETVAIDAIKSYMEASGSLVAFLLEKFRSKKDGKIIMSGGAAMSDFWPQVISDLCGLTVEAVNFPEFTAYGAALHAKSAFENKQSNSNIINIAESRHYEPIHADKYQQWYEKNQKPMFEKLLAQNCK